MISRKCQHVCSFEGANLYSSLAQSVEHAAVNRSVVGSSPTGGAFLFSDFKQRAQWFSKMKAIVFFVILLYKSEAIGIY